MTSRASIAHHPIHPMLIPLPIGLWVFSLVADVIYRAGWGGPVWLDVAFFTMAGGCVGAILAAVPGLIDFLSLREPRTQRVAAAHMILNVSVLIAFLVNLWLRTVGPPGAFGPFLLSIVAVGVLTVSGWLGWELIYVHGVAVAGRTEPRISIHERDRTGRAAS